MGGRSELGADFGEPLSRLVEVGGVDVTSETFEGFDFGVTDGCERLRPFASTKHSRPRRGHRSREHVTKHVCRLS